MWTWNLSVGKARTWRRVYAAVCTDCLPLHLHNPANLLNNAANPAGQPRLSGSGWVCSIPFTEFHAHETAFLPARSFGGTRNRAP